VPLLACGMTVVCGFRIWEEWHQRRWTPVWRSVVEKLEAAALALESSAGREARPG
jgi:hypothetical protein